MESTFVNSLYLNQCLWVREGVDCGLPLPTFSEASVRVRCEIMVNI